MTPAPEPQLTPPSIPPSSIGTPPPVQPPVADAEATILPAPDPPKKRIAFLVIHGIGQQRPYETLDQFGRGLLDSFRADTPAATWNIYPQLNIAQDPEHVQKDWVRASYRLEPDKPVAFQGDSHTKGDTIQDLSLFEYYWAPITQDKITYTGSLLFLIKAGFQPFLYLAANINAIANTDGEIKGGRIIKIAVKEILRQAFLFLPLILLLAGALWWLSGLSAFALPDVIKKHPAIFVVTVIFLFIRYLYAGTSLIALRESLETKTGWQRNLLWRIYLVILVLFNVVVYPFLLSPLLWWTAKLGSCSIRIIHCRWIPDYVGHWSNALRAVALQTADLHSGCERFYWFLLLDPSLKKYISLVAWLLIAAFLRYVLIGYVGDVAVYVNASELAKNFAARSQILDECTAALTTLLKQRIDPKNPDSDLAYDQVYVAAHSLGSVIAYDTINSLLDRARTADPNEAQIQAADLFRLRGMVTFGSPLNKIFYFFRERTDPRAALRNQTLDILRGCRVVKGLKDAVGGPYKFAEPTNEEWKQADKALNDKFRWINAYSVEDPISGRLVFYDLEGVENQKAFHGYPPLIAHLSYWKDPNFYAFVRQRLL